MSLLIVQFVMTLETVVSGDRKWRLKPFKTIVLICVVSDAEASGSRCEDQLEMLSICSLPPRLLWLLQTSSSSTCPVSNICWETVGSTEIPTVQSSTFTSDLSVCLTCLSVCPGLTELMTIVKRAVQNSLGRCVSVTDDYSAFAWLSFYCLFLLFKL